MFMELDKNNNQHGGINCSKKFKFIFCYFNLNLTNSNEFGSAVISKGRLTSNKYIISNLCPGEG